MMTIMRVKEDPSRALRNIQYHQNACGQLQLTSRLSLRVMQTVATKIENL